MLAAKVALKFGAIYGQGRGIQGHFEDVETSSKCPGHSYGLITKNLKKGYYEPETGITYHKAGLKSISPEMITDNIRELYSFARKNKDKFYLFKI